MKQFKLNTDASHLIISAKEIIAKEMGDYYPVFNNIFAQSAQSALTKYNSVPFIPTKEPVKRIRLFAIITSLQGPLSETLSHYACSQATTQRYY